MGTKTRYTTQPFYSFFKRSHEITIHLKHSVVYLLCITRYFHSPIACGRLIRLIERFNRTDN